MRVFRLEVFPANLCLRSAPVLLLVLLLSACSTSQQVMKASEPRPVQEPVKNAEPKPEMSEQDMFRAAGTAFRDKDYETSATLYLKLIEKAPEGRYANVSRFNGGLSLERLKRYSEAVPYYEEVAKRTAGSKDAHDAFFRAATCMQSAERWDEAKKYWTRVLKPEYAQISEHDQMEAHVKRAWAYEKLGDMARAERDYKGVFRLHRNNLDNRLIRTTPLVALAHQRVGYLYGSLVDSIQIMLPVERMARDIEEKANYFLKAQSHLLDAIRRHHPEHSLAAGHRLGTLFESFYLDLMNAEVPEELGKDDHVVYIQELKKKVRPLIEKAVYTYRRTVELGNRLDYNGAWTKKARLSLKRLESYIAAEAAKEVPPKGKEVLPKGKEVLPEGTTEE